MKRYCIILSAILLVISTPTKAKVAYSKGDSIMKMVIANAERYQNLLESSEAEIYIKGHTEILKRNRLFRYAYHVFPVSRRAQDMVFEMISNSKFEPPNLFTHTIEAINGSSIPNSKKQQEAVSFLNMNVYASTAFNDEILMPLAKNAFKYYTYEWKDSQDTAGLTIHRIRFLPKQLSQKLISGDLYVVDKVWTIDKVEMSGRYDFSDFHLIVTYGRGYNRFNLPETADLYIRYKLLGNAIANTYHSKFDYKSVVWSEKGPNRDTRKSSLDLTGYYRLSSDSVPIIIDTAYWQTKRDIPLSPDEKNLYEHITDKRLQDVSKDSVTSPTPAMQYLELTEKLTNTIRMDYKSTRIRYSGLLNPFQLGYSGSNGITYRQRLRINKRYSNGQELYFRPEVGYLFGRKELYFKALGEWTYKPERLGAVSLLVGNGNQSYSSEMMRYIKEALADSIRIEDLNLQCFKHYYVELKNRCELSNGFLLYTSLTYNHRRPVEKISNWQVGEDVIEIINEDYNDFTPAIGFSYTPRQYYQMDGKKKEYVYSYYPTLSVEFSRAIPDVLDSDGDFGRIEVDLHQNISLGLLRRFNYHVSGGVYTKNKSRYFADFRYFTKRNFPDTWDDQIGGIFNLLRREYFNASDKYVQAHVMYQSPFIFLPAFSKKFGSKYVFSERLYLSQLWTPIKPNYTEIGYGIGNHLFNIAAFVSFDDFKYQRFGVRFSFELFE